ncbi:MAG: DUF2817 domain-containing protein [Alphaproteobacteria bacterium]|nr:DUF2817 domain-containing protein [Alphaproteobacteria bacterium]
MTAELFFSARVDEAGEKFLDACTRAGAQTALFRHPRGGPHGETLHTIVARLGRSDAPNRRVIVSGTHGIEGHAGSAIQCAVLGDATRRHGQMTPR